MSILWTYFWPCFGAGLLCGVIAGIFAFRAPRVRVKAAEDEIATALETWARRRKRALIAGGLITCIAVGLWHGPLGAANRLAIEERAHRRDAAARVGGSGPQLDHLPNEDAALRLQDLHHRRRDPLDGGCG